MTDVEEIKNDSGTVYNYGDVQWIIKPFEISMMAGKDTTIYLIRDVNIEQDMKIKYICVIKGDRKGSKILLTVDLKMAPGEFGQLPEIRYVTIDKGIPYLHTHVVNMMKTVQYDEARRNL